MRKLRGLAVYGVELDSQGRCVHYRSEFDVVALKLGCCESYFACHLCHEDLADHPLAPWPKGRFHEPSVLCCVCGHEMTASEYSGASSCASCGAAFNPGCKAHWAIYFESPLESE